MLKKKNECTHFKCTDEKCNISFMIQALFITPKVLLYSLLANPQSPLI